MRLRSIMIIVFCLAALMPTMLFWFWPNSSFLQSEIENAREQHRMVAKTVSTELTRYLDNLPGTFSEIAEKSIKSDTYQPDRELLKVADFLNICVSDYSNGEVLISNAGTAGACPARYVEEDLMWFSDQLGNREKTAVITKIRKTDDAGIVFNLLYRADNRLVVGTVSTEHVRSFSSPIRFRDLGHATIVDHVGQIISHPEAAWVERLQSLNDVSVVKNIASGGGGVAQYFSPLLGTEVVAGYASVPVVNWGVIVAEPLGNLESRVNSVKFSTLSALGIGLLIAIIMAFFATRLLTFPIVQMVQAMERIGNGELRAYEKIKEGQFQPLEFRKARDSIKAMAEKLQENIDTISKHAYLDGITGLPNRECFKVLAKQEIERLAATGQKGALLFLDLDGFKQVNDVYGHRSGDDLLKGFAQNIHTYCGNEMKRRASGVDNAINILPARLGGDEFVVFIGNVRSVQILNEFANGLFQSVFGKFKLHNGIVLNVNGSVGGALFPEHASDFDELLRLADIAMYKAKKGGKGKFCLHEEVDEFAANEAKLAYEVDA